ncbi:putative type VI secretion system effector [uncultured Acinetobacter sp.]|uniref:putative type VI secretion system effector n=1 Tax=uncultured Acinetobacter sp. TaxID=165433 RepID=UPI00258E97F4|nr:putative type VI secretion system effector [uncultured Acinetobacter sp.]
MYEMLKFEGRIQRLEIYDDSLSAFGKSGNTQITVSAILSDVAESVSLSAQTVFLASHSRLHVQSVVIEIDGKICISQFHRALLKENEYIICIVKKIGENLYELYSILSPETGLLHMQVGMGGSVKKSYESVIKGGRVWYLLGVAIISIVLILSGDFNKENLLSWGGVLFLFYFILFYILKKSFESIRHFSEKSEEIFKIYGFENPVEIFLLSGRHYSDDYKILLESVYEYRKVIKKDPYPESYVGQIKRNV